MSEICLNFANFRHISDRFQIHIRFSYHVFLFFQKKKCLNCFALFLISNNTCFKVLFVFALCCVVPASPSFCNILVSAKYLLQLIRVMLGIVIKKIKIEFRLSPHHSNTCHLSASWREWVLWSAGATPLIDACLNTFVRVCNCTSLSTSHSPHILARFVISGWEQPHCIAAVARFCRLVALSSLQDDENRGYVVKGQCAFSRLSDEVAATDESSNLWMLFPRVDAHAARSGMSVTNLSLCELNRKRGLLLLHHKTRFISAMPVSNAEARDLFLRGPVSMTGVWTAPIGTTADDDNASADDPLQSVLCWQSPSHDSQRGWTGHEGEESLPAEYQLEPYQLQPTLRM